MDRYGGAGGRQFSQATLIGIRCELFRGVAKMARIVSYFAEPF